MYSIVFFHKASNGCAILESFRVCGEGVKVLSYGVMHP